MTSRLVLGLMFIGVTGLAHADELKIDREYVNFSAGAGYCGLEARQFEYDRLLIESQRKAQLPANQLLQIFQTCESLERLRWSPQNGKIGRYGMVLLPLTNNQPTRIPGISREIALTELTKALNNGQDIDTKDITQRVNEALRDTGGSRAGQVDISGAKPLGVIDRDDSAVYQGMLLTISANNQTKRLANITAMTYVKGYIVAYSLYDDYVDESSIKSVLAETKATMRDFVAKNP
jgi:hypothetical protein